MPTQHTFLVVLALLLGLAPTISSQSISIQSLSITATSQAGSPETGDGSAGNERKVLIGEVVTYQLVLEVPEGSAADVVVTALLPDGLQYVAGSALLTSTSDNGLTYSPTLTGGGSSGADVSFDLGTVNNSDNDANVETIEITFDALVVNEVGNQDGTLLTNQAELTIGGSTISTSEERTVAVVEPSLEVTVRQRDAHNGPDITEGDAGDEYVYRVFVSNTGNAPAYDIKLTGMMPKDFASQFGTLTAAGGGSPGGFTYNQTTGVWGFAWGQINTGQTVSATLRFRVKNTVRPSDSWTSTVDIAYSSLPGVDANERNGDDGAGGALDDYLVTATSPAFTVSEPVVAKQVEHPSQTSVASFFGGTYTDTSSDPNTNTEQYSTNVDVAIGETFSYIITVTFPEGTTSDFTMIDVTSPVGQTSGLQFRVIEMLSAEVIHVGANLSGNGIEPVGTFFDVDDLNGDGDGSFSQLYFGGDRDILNTPDNVTNDDDRYVIRITARMDDEDESGGLADDLEGVSNNAGDMAGNRLQYQWRDSDETQYTRNVVARTDIVEPNVSITTTTDIGTNVDAGDQVQFTINLNNTGTATAYNVQVTDVLPFIGMTNYVSFEAVDMSASTCDNLGGFTVNAGTPPNVVFNFDALAANTSCSITFTGIVGGGVTPNETYTNQVSLNSYTSQPNAAALDVRTYTGGNASSTITTKEPVIVKSYVSTSEAHTDPGDTRSGANDANEVPLAIGELIRYNIAVTLIEGLHINLVVEDLLPVGIEALYNSNFQVSMPAGVSTTNAGLASGATTSIYNDAGMPLVNSFNLSPNPGNLSFFLGTVTTNANRDNSVSEVIVIAFDAIVLNSAAANNNIGRNSDNRATFSEGSGSSSAQSNIVHARIQEPVVSISKTLNTTLSNPVGTGPFKKGDQVVYDIVLTAGNAANQTTAFDLSVLDNLDADLDLASVDFVGAPAYATIADNSDYTAPGQSVDVSISELRPGDAITIRVTATITSTACTDNISNTASLTYTSLPGLKGTNDATPGNSGTDRGERNGSGGINDYFGSDDVMISVDQQPDFTLNVVQPTCEMAGSISFAALTGGTYTYAFSTNGVDYSPLTPDMGQLSIALPAGEQPATTYSIRVTRTDLATNCETIKTANIQEVSNCCPDITAVQSGTTTICPGSGTNISVAITGGSGSYTVVYSPDGGNTTTTVDNYISGADIAITPAQTTTYTLVSVTDTENCPAMVSGSAVITVEDVTAPVFDCNTLTNITANTSSDACNASVSITAPTALDNCDGPVVATGVRSDGAALSAPYPTGATTITWTFEDAADNSIQCMQNVVVTDNTPPTITTCPAARNVDGCDESAITGPAYSATVSISDYATFSDAINQGAASDNCGITEVAYQDVSNGTCPIVVTRTWTLKDAVGNPTTCEQTIQINATAVVLDCPADANEAPCQTQTEIDDAFALWLAAVTASGGCNTTVTNDATAAPDAKGGSVTVTFTASSDCQDDVACMRTFTVASCFIISGNIVWEHDRTANPFGIPGATVALTGDETGNDNTDANGDYAIPIGGGYSFTLTPTKTGNAYDGVDVADVTRIQQHVTFIDRFDDGYKTIAADVNLSNSVTGLDAAVLFHAINGNPNAEAIFEDPSWRFVDSTHTFMDENAPWPFPEDISLMNVMADVLNQSFVGVKMGDVNGTWAGPVLLTSPPLGLMVQDQALKAEQTIRVPFRANGLPDVAAWQFALRFDTDYLRFERALPTAAFPLKDENFGAWQADAGELRSVFAVPQGLVLPKDEVIFELEFQVVYDGLHLSEVLRLDNGILDGRVYNTALNGGAVALAFEAVETRRIASLLPGEAALGFALEQNIPNPFSNETLIRFELPEAGEAVFSVHDVQGRLLYEQRGFLDAGLHEVRLDAARLGATGVLSYTLRTGAHSATRRMVLVR